MIISASNYGTRIDCIFASSTLVPLITGSSIHSEILGSDHCPISATFDLAIDSDITTYRSPVRRAQSSLTSFFKRGSTAVEENTKPKSEKTSKKSRIDHFFEKAPLTLKSSSKDPKSSKACNNNSEINVLPFDSGQSSVSDQKNNTIELQQQWHNILAKPPPPKCLHGEPAKEQVVNKPGTNKGRVFYVCARLIGPVGSGSGALTEYRCDYFKWKTNILKKSK
ncbi:Class II abasic (AP) endonuclease [Nowakowskiella sp. JEL0078]|nr:Class II abasic (AP) endonuclease [Nowakowskiella sp. JEL0078]